MIKQDWMIIVAGEELVDAMTAETKARVPHTGFGYASDNLCALQRERAGRGIIGVEVISTGGPPYNCPESHSVRYDSGLQEWGLLVSGRRGGLTPNTLEAAEAWARAWVAQDPTHRYAWRRKPRQPVV